MSSPPRRPSLVVASIRGRGSFPGDVLERLEAEADVTFLAQTATMSRAEALFAFRAADYVAVTNKVAPRFDETLLRGLPKLRGMSVYATGYDAFDPALLGRYGVELSILPDYSTQAVAEHTLGLLLSVSCRIHLGNDRSRGFVPPDTSLRGFELHGRSLGIVGCGRIGSRVASLAQGVGMRVQAYDIDPKPVEGVTYVERAELFATSDVVTLHCPLPFGAPPMIGEAELAAMPVGSVLVNSSRAALVDDDAVVEAVRSGHLRGYAVDDTVFVDDEVADLVREGRILQTGHSAWWSDETLERGARLWGEHLLAMVRGTPLDVVEETRPPTVVARDDVS